MNFKILHITYIKKIIIIQGVVAEGFIKVGDTLYNTIGQPFLVCGINSNIDGTIQLTVKKNKNFNINSLNLGDTITNFYEKI